MEKINEQKQLLQDISYLLAKMEAEIELLRNINYRYYLMHGNKVQNGLITVPENISFDVSGEINGDVQCQIIDHKKINIESNYMIIKYELNKIK